MTKNKPKQTKKAREGPLRLFMLVGPDGKAMTDGQGELLYFSDKRTAKAKRQDGQHIAVGPDHWRYRHG